MVNIKTLGDSNWRDFSIEDDPTSAKHRPSKAVAREMVDAIKGHRGAPKTHAYTAVPFDYVDIDTSQAPFTVTMPEELAEGDEFFFNDLRGSWPLRPLTIAGNGTQIDDGTDELKDNLVCDIPGRFTLVYADGVLRMRSVSTDWRKLDWSIEFNIGSRLVAEWREDDVDLQVDDGGGLLSAWTDRLAGITLTAAGDLRPTRIEGKGVFFNLAHQMKSVGVGPIATGSDYGSIVWYGTQLALDSAVRNLVGVGSSTNFRALRIQQSEHQPGAVTQNTSHDVDDKNVSGVCVLQGKFGDGQIELVLNGEYLGSIPVTLDTEADEVIFGSSFADPITRFARGYFKRVLFLNGRTSHEEDARMAAELLGAENWERLAPEWQYLARPHLDFDENLAAINAAIALAPVTVPDEEVDYTGSVAVTVNDGEPSPVLYPLGADAVNERPLLQLVQGWVTDAPPNLLEAPMGLLGVLDSDIGPHLFSQATSFRVGARITSRHIAVHGFGVFHEETGTHIKMRAIVQDVGSGDPPRYVDRDGYTVALQTGDNSYEFDFGTVATRDFWFEVAGSNKFGGFYVEAGGLVEPLPYSDALDLRVFWFSDSFGAGTGSDQNYDSFNIFTADRLGLPAGQFAGNVGGGWEADSNGGGIYNATQRSNDVTDADLTERGTIGITARSRTKAIFAALGVNDAPIDHTAEEWKAIIKPILQNWRTHLPWAPGVVAGPWDRYYPDDVSDGWREVDDGLQAAVAEVPGFTYLSMEGVAYERVKDVDLTQPNNIHPTELGHQQLAQNLAPRIKAALLAMA